jgi:hypothetical protein
MFFFCPSRHCRHNIANCHHHHTHNHHHHHQADQHLNPLLLPPEESEAMRLMEVERLIKLERDMCAWEGVGVMEGRIHSFSLIGCQVPCPLSNLIGADLGLISELQRINLSNNQLHGPLPIQESLAALRMLRQLSLSRNCLSGPLTHVSLLRQLADLDLSHNALTGPLPPHLCLHLPELVTLNLSHNKLHGKLPSELK